MYSSCQCSRNDHINVAIHGQTLACSFCLYKRRYTNILMSAYLIINWEITWLMFVHVQCLPYTLIHCASRKCWDWNMLVHQYKPPSFFSSCSWLVLLKKKKEYVQTISQDSEFLALPWTSCVPLEKWFTTPCFDGGSGKMWFWEVRKYLIMFSQVRWLHNKSTKQVRPRNF